MDPVPHSLRDAPVRLDLEQIHLNGSFPPRLHVIDPSCTLNVAERVAELRHTDLFPELSWNALPYPAVLFFFCFRDVSCRRQYEVPKSTFESCKKKQMGFLLRPDAVCIGLSTSEQHPPINAFGSILLLPRGSLEASPMKNTRTHMQHKYDAHVTCQKKPQLRIVFSTCSPRVFSMSFPPSELRNQNHRVTR